MADFDRKAMLEMFIYEMNQSTESLEDRILKSESGFTSEDINEIFRLMHTIKGSAAMMLYDNISKTAHAVEDMFYYLREQKLENYHNSKITDVVLESLDFIKQEISKIENGNESDGNCDEIIKKIQIVLNEIKEIKVETETKLEQTLEIPEIDFNKNRNTNRNVFFIKFQFVENCEMKNIRAFTIINSLNGLFENYSSYPENILDADSLSLIENNGFSITITTLQDFSSIFDFVMKSSYIDYVIIHEIIMGNPDENLENLNCFMIHIDFANGYGENNENIFNTIPFF